MVWKPGQSGNPKGRNVNKPITDALEWAVRLPVKALDGDRPRKGKTAAQAMALAQIRQAREGSTPAFTAIADRIEGKPAQSLAITDETPSHNLAALPIEAVRQLLVLAEERQETGEPLAIALEQDRQESAD